MKAKKIDLSPDRAMMLRHKFFKNGGNLYDFSQDVVDAMLATFRGGTVLEYYVNKSYSYPNSGRLEFVVFGKKYDYDIIRINENIMKKITWKKGTIGGIIYKSIKADFYQLQ